MQHKFEEFNSRQFRLQTLMYDDEAGLLFVLLEKDGKLVIVQLDANNKWAEKVNASYSDPTEQDPSTIAFNSCLFHLKDPTIDSHYKLHGIINFGTIAILKGNFPAVEETIYKYVNVELG